MDLLVRLRWVNGGTPNLPASFANNVAHAPGATNVAANRSDIEIRVTGDGGPGVSQNGSSSGVDYLVSNVGQSLSVSVTFWLTVPKPPGSPVEAFRGPTLKVNQTFSVNASGATPTSARLPQGGSVTAHPLVAVAAAAALANGTPVVVLNIDTTFVDVTDHWAAWMRMTSCREWTIYNQQHTPGTTLAVLAYTVQSDTSPNGDTKGPTFWFVSIPDSCVVLPAGKPVSHVVFFKPDVGYHTSHLNNQMHAVHGMYALARFLLSPAQGAPETTMSNGKVRAWYGDRFSPPPKLYVWLCARMEAALAASGKCALLVMPLPYGADYREAATVALTTDLLPSLLDTLFSVGKVATGQTTQPARGKTVVAGYSSGGGAAFNAVLANSAAVDEVYLFDPFGSGGGIKSMGDALSTWATSGASPGAGQTTPRRLCIVWGSNPLVDAQDCARKVSAAAPGATVVAPSVASFYSSGSPPGDPWWNDSAVSYSAMWTYGDISPFRHQFAIFGGDDPAWSRGSRVTFFQSFLTGSSL